MVLLNKADTIFWINQNMNEMTYPYPKGADLETAIEVEQFACQR